MPVALSEEERKTLDELQSGFFRDVIEGKMRPFSLYYRIKEETPEEYDDDEMEGGRLDIWLILGEDPKKFIEDRLGDIYSKLLHRKLRDYERIRNNFRAIRAVVKRYNLQEYTLQEIKRRNLEYKGPEAYARALANR